MARGRKRVNLTTDEQIMKLEEDIKSCQDQLVLMKEKLKDLQEQKKKEEIEKLYQAVLATGKSVDDFLVELNGEAV